MLSYVRDYASFVFSALDISKKHLPLSFMVFGLPHVDLRCQMAQDPSYPFAYSKFPGHDVESKVIS